MKIIKRVLSCFPLVLFQNLIFLITFIPNKIASVALVALLAVFYIRVNIVPSRSKSAKRRIRILSGGCELMLMSFICFTIEALAYISILIKGWEIKTHILIINAVVFIILFFIPLLNGIIRVFVSSTQLGILPRVLLFFFWWVPVFNVVLLKKFIDVSGEEYRFTVKKEQLNINRKHEELCKTRYPLLMVNGIFWRDWKIYNYWGRIPKELIDNGAAIYYGNQQSAASVEQCGNEIKQRILEIVRETGCEKVNIIAHSKGGLDSRYAISCPDMGRYVASLTTINTPHYGCKYVGEIINRISEKTISVIDNKYNSLYAKLGDDAPHFFDGLAALTDTECARLNKMMPDVPGVLYQSIGSRLRSRWSAPFPLNVGYIIMSSAGEKDNDGMVSTESMMWGEFLGVLTPKGKDGISHGDVIDLSGKNIEGFDVCELFVDLVHKLKARGL